MPPKRYLHPPLSSNMISPQVGFCDIYKNTADTKSNKDILIKFYNNSIITSPYFGLVTTNNICNYINSLNDQLNNTIIN